MLLFLLARRTVAGAPLFPRPWREAQNDGQENEAVEEAEHNRQEENLRGRAAEDGPYSLCHTGGTSIIETYLEKHDEYVGLRKA